MDFSNNISLQVCQSYTFCPSSHYVLGLCQCKLGSFPYLVTVNVAWREVGNGKFGLLFREQGWLVGLKKENLVVEKMCMLCTKYSTHVTESAIDALFGINE